MKEVKIEIDGESVLEDEKEAFKDDNTIIAEDIIEDGKQLRVDSTGFPNDFGLLSDDELANLSPEQLEVARRQFTESYFPLPDDFPSEEKLKEWQTTYGKVRTRRVSFKEAYVLRPMTRVEFRQYVRMVDTHSEDPIENRMYQEELMVEICILYPKVTVRDISGETNPSARIAAAGTASILSADIQEISNMAPDTIGPIEEL